jgi:hypothetical protein
MWNPPQLNTDGTALTDISGYRILYGTGPTALGQSVAVGGVGATSQVINGLSVGSTYYFALVTVNSGGQSSIPSNSVSMTVQ